MTTGYKKTCRKRLGILEYQEGCEECEESAEAEDDGVPDALRQHRLPAEEALVAGADPIHHRVVLTAETQLRRRTHHPRHRILTADRAVRLYLDSSYTG